MRSRLVPLVLAHVRAAGHDADALADAYGVDEALRDPARWTMDAPAVPIVTSTELCEHAARLLDEPSLGLRLARELPRGSYGVLEHAARNAPTVRAACERLVRYQRLINDAVEYSVIDEDGRVGVGHALSGHADAVGAHANLFTIAALHRFLEQTGVSEPPEQVVVAHAEPRVDLGFGAARVRWGAGYNVLLYPAHVFDAAVAHADPTLLPILDEYAAQLLPPEDPASGWRARVRDHLRRHLCGGVPSLEQTARHLGTSSRNLQRQLASLSTTYSEVLDTHREDEARRLVADPSLALDEIAFLLGYSGSRAFVRAFKRWTGRSPGAFRRA